MHFACIVDANNFHSLLEPSRASAGAEAWHPFAASCAARYCRRIADCIDDATNDALVNVACRPVSFMTAQITDPTVCQARQNFVNASRTGYVRVDTSVDDHYHSGFVSSRSSLVLLHTGPRLLTRIDRAGSHNFAISTVLKFSKVKRVHETGEVG